MRAENPRSEYFKILGAHDVLELAKIDNLHEAIRVNSDIRILSIHSFPCFCFNNRAELFSRVIGRAISPSLILIKLQDFIFNRLGLEGLATVANRLCSFGRNVHPLISMGYYEILIWFQSSNLKGVFSFINQVRRLTVSDLFPKVPVKSRSQSLILASITIPLVSYKNIIEPEPPRWQALKGRIAPIVNIKCTPGYEEQIAAELVTKLAAETHLILGADDLVCFWSQPIELGTFVKTLMEFREFLTEHTVHDTVTRIYHVPRVEPDATKKKGNPPSPKPLGILEQIGNLGRNKGTNQFIIGELINLISLVNTHIGNFTIGESCYEIHFSILTYLNALIDEYEAAVNEDDRARVSRAELMLLLYSSCLRSSVTQQFSSRGYSEYSDAGSHPTFAGSLVRIIKAMSLIPEQLFRVLSQSAVPEELHKRVQCGPADNMLISSFAQYSKPWMGFLFLDLAEGYRIIHQGEMIAVPYKDIFSFLNWITLTHEVAHGYYARIDFEGLEEKYLDQVLPSVDSLEGEKPSIFRTNRRITVSEWFAHWFDYRHFFNGDLHFYLWSIWRTYLEIPRVYRFKFDYWARSLFIWCCYRWPDLVPKIKDISRSFPNNVERMDQFAPFFLEELEALCAFLETKFKGNFNGISLSNEEKIEVFGMFYPHVDLLWLFEEKYVSEDIIKSINAGYPLLDRHISVIREGKIATGKIENPFLLLKEILRSYYLNDWQAPSIDVAVAFIFSLWEASRNYKREMPQPEKKP